MGIPDHLTCLLRNLYAGQEGKTYIKQLTGLKLGKEYIKAVYCHPAYLTYMKSTTCEMWGWMKNNLEIKIAGRNINNLRYAEDTTLVEKCEDKLKSLLMKVKGESETSGLNSTFTK